MIDEEIKTAIITSAKDHMLQSDWQFIDTMFEEVYRTSEGGVNLIVLKPFLAGEDIAMSFIEINGSFYEIVSWDETQRIGERIQ